LGRKPNISSQDDRLPGKALVTSFGESVPPRLRLLLAVASLVASLAAARRARADAPSLDGTWRQGPLKEEYTVQKWLSACGPAPVSGSNGGGETVTIRQEGDELSFVGGGRVFHSNQCYDQMPTLVRETHTRDPSGKTWRTRCITPPSDPRRGAIDTRVDITTAKHIDIQESGRYEISLNEGKCTADVKRTRGFDLVTAEAPVATTPTPPTPTATAVAPTANACNSPGEPARLEVRPSRKLLRTGDTFAFRAIVLDESGCATRTATTWALGDPASGGKGLALASNGTVTISPEATEGTYELVASAAGKSAHVSIEVASPSRYDDLLAASGLNDAGESEGASIAMIAGETLGGGDAKAEDGSSRRRTAFLAIVLATALALGIVALIGARRSRRAASIEREAQERHADRVRETEERRHENRSKHDAAVRAHETSLAAAARLAAEEADAPPLGAVRMLCPACRREYDAESLYCPQDSNRLVPLNAPAGAGPLGGICPTCKRGYDPGISVCPQDNDELVPYALYASRNPQSVAPARAKICPTCGGRFDGNAAFCGKDGTALVLLN
jgi:hypothetical protein